MPHRADPNYHDERAKTLLEAAQHIKTMAKEQPNRRTAAGMQEAVAELRRLASAARRAHRKAIDLRRQQADDYNAKSRAFGLGG